MAGVALVRRVDAMLDELRAAWASGRRVALTVDGGRRVEGHVGHVATTGVFVDVGSKRVMADAVLAVHLPSRLGDSTIRTAAFHEGPRDLEPAAGQLALF